MAPLSYLILDERRNQQWQDYTASTLWMIGRMLGKESWKLEPYTEFAYPNKTKDQRTPEQIKADIVRRLTA